MGGGGGRGGVLLKGFFLGLCTLGLRDRGFVRRAEFVVTDAGLPLFWGFGARSPTLNRVGFRVCWPRAGKAEHVTFSKWDAKSPPNPKVKVWGFIST